MIRWMGLLLIPMLLGADIDAEIAAIQKAPVQERFKLMNALKHKLAKMKEKQRIEAMEKLQSKTLQKDQRIKVEEDLQEELESDIEDREERRDDD